MPRQPLTIAEKQQRQMLRKLARGAGKRIAQQSAIVQNRAIEEARRMQALIEGEQWRIDNNRTIGTNQRAVNLAEAVRSVTSVVRASFGLDQPVKYQYHSGDRAGRILSAKTNLKEIILNINVARLLNDDEDSIKKTIAILKGATYHEVAHCLWTKNWKNYNFPEGFDFIDYFRAWNLLEDGRIETLLIEKSPIIRNYLLPLLYEVVLSKTPNGWTNVVDGAPFLIVRSYLPKGIQRSVINACQQADSDMTILAEMHRVSTAYQQADSWDAQIPYVIEFHNLLALWNVGRGYPDGGNGDPDPHGDHTQTDEGDEAGNPGGEPVYRKVSKPTDTDWDRDELLKTPTPPNPEPAEQQKPEDESDETDTGSGTDDSESEDGADTDNESSGSSDSGDTSSDSDSQSDEDSKSPNKPTEGGQAGSGEGGEPQQTPTTREIIEEAFNESIDDAVSSHELNEVISQYHQAMSRGLQKAIGEGEDITNPETIQKATNLTLGMINALDTIVVTPDPSWHYHMDDGAILDLEAFTNRDIGDDSYWMDKDGIGERGHDLAVSLLLDCSASMGYYLTELGVVAYAVRKACDHFDIPCTTVLFGSDSNLLWDAGDEPSLTAMPNLGSTNIGRALLDTPNHRHGKGRHLIVVFTDGEWGDVESIRPFFANGETTLLIGFGMGIHTLQQRGADVAVSINNLLDLPSEVEKSIARFFI